MRRWLVAFGVGVAFMFAAGRRPGAERHRRRGQRRDRRGASWRDGRSEQSGADREGARRPTTNEAGQYRVVDLRPGTYTVTFTLTGFSTVVREGIVLEANFTAPINVDMQVGIGRGEHHGHRRDARWSTCRPARAAKWSAQELLEAIPTGRSFVLMAGTVPAVTTGRLRRRRLERDVDRRQPAGARLARPAIRGR